MNETEVIFAVRESPEGGYEGFASSHSILVQANSIEELREAVRQRVQALFGPDDTPGVIRLHHVREEVLVLNEDSKITNELVQPPSFLREDGKELALAYFNHVETQVSLAATTAYLTLVADTILINAYVTVFKDTELSRRLVWSAGGFLCSATLCALLAVIPHMKKKSGTVFYFRTVASMSDVDYVKEFGIHERNNTLYEELLKQVRGKCRHLRWMFWVVRAAIFFTFLGTLLMMYAFASTHNSSARPDNRPPTSNISGACLTQQTFARRNAA